jgi:hypothetical protein
LSASGAVVTARIVLGLIILGLLACEGGRRTSGRCEVAVKRCNTPNVLAYGQAAYQQCLRAGGCRIP